MMQVKVLPIKRRCDSLSDQGEMELSTIRPKLVAGREKNEGKTDNLKLANGAFSWRNRGLEKCPSLWQHNLNTKWLTKPSHTRTNISSLCAALRVGGGQIDPS
jgi:hypothetical protein